MKYKAFISYSHSEDRLLSIELQRTLETYARKFYQPRRIRVFRDETNLNATPNLWVSILESLKKSEYLLYLASPEAADSKWVKKEVRWWLENKDPKNIIIFLTKGKILWDDEKNQFDTLYTNSISSNVFQLFDSEPLYYDLTWAKKSGLENLRNNNHFIEQMSSVAATLLDKDRDSLAGEHATEQRKFNRVKSVVAVVSITGLIIMSALAYVANKQKDEAIIARDQETIARAEAEKLINFLDTEIRIILEPLERTDVMKKVFNKTQEYFNTYKSNSDNGLRYKIAEANNIFQNAIINEKNGNLETVRNDFEKALSLLNNINTDNPGILGVEYTLQVYYDRIGFLHLGNLNYKEALVNFNWSLHYIKKISQRSKLDLSLRVDEATSYMHIGEVYLVHAMYENSKIEKTKLLYSAIKFIEKSLKILDMAYLLDRDLSGIDVNLFFSNLKIGHSYIDLYDYEKTESNLTIAIRHYREAMKYVDNINGNSLSKILLWNAMGEHSLKKVRSIIKKEPNNKDINIIFNDAIDYFRKSLDKNIELLKHDPNNMDWVMSLSRCYYNMSRIERFSNNITSEKTLIDQSLAEIEKVKKHSPLTAIDQHFETMVKERRQKISE